MSRTAVLVTLGVWLALSVTLALTDARPAVVALLGLVAAASAVALLAHTVFSGAEGITWPTARRAYRSRRGGDPRVGSLRSQLYAAGRYGADELRTTLVALVDDRLAAHHGIDRAQDPERAARRLGPAVSRFLTAPDPRTLSDPRRLHELLSEIEAL